MAQNSDLLIVRRRNPAQNVSRIFTLADADVPAYAGQALQQKSGDDAVNAELCDSTAGGVFLGFLTRDVTSDGARVGSTRERDELFFNGPDGLLQTPFVSGGAVSLELPDEILVQTNVTAGSRHVVDSGTGALTHTVIDALSLNDGLNFKDGKLRVAQSTEFAEYAFAGVVTKTAEAATNDRAFLAVRRHFIVP